MLEFLGWALRVAAAIAAIVAGVTVYAARPEADTPAAISARGDCALGALNRFMGGMDVSPGAAMRQQTELLARCPPEPRRDWEAATVQRGLTIGGGALALLIAGTVLGSMARREALAEEALREMRGQGDHR
jgi:hypothetical protein